jgi:hypothetical protein
MKPWPPSRATRSTEPQSLFLDSLRVARPKLCLGGGFFRGAAWSQPAATGREAAQSIASAIATSLTRSKHRAWRSHFGLHQLVCALIASSTSCESEARMVCLCRSSSTLFTIAITARNISKITRTDTISSHFRNRVMTSGSRVRPPALWRNGPYVQNV